MNDAYYFKCKKHFKEAINHMLEQYDFQQYYTNPNKEYILCNSDVLIWINHGVGFIKNLSGNYDFFIEIWRIIKNEKGK